MGGGPTGLWLSELAEPYYLFKEAGLEVQIASTAGGAVPIDANSMGGDFFTAEAKKFMHDQEAFGLLCHSSKVGDLNAESFDCVYLTGGHGCCMDFVGVQAAGLINIVQGACARPDPAEPSPTAASRRGDMLGFFVCAECALRARSLARTLAPRVQMPSASCLRQIATALWA